MKGQLSWFVLFLARIVAAEVLPPEYLTECKYVVEAPSVAGIYIYMQPLEIIMGNPTMVLVQKIAVPGKKNFNFDEQLTERIRISWSQSKNTSAFMFGVCGKLLTVKTAEHFCLRRDSNAVQHWAIYDESLKINVGWSTLVNDVTGVTCNPEIGLLSYITPSDAGATDNEPYALPTYGPFNLVYDCVTYLRNLELSSGVASEATAASLDSSGKCKLWYQPHSSFQFVPGVADCTDRACFLEETPGLIATPVLGFYSNCIIRLIHPNNPGTFRLSESYKTSHDTNLYSHTDAVQLNGIVKTIPNTTYRLIFDKSTSTFTPSKNLIIDDSFNVNVEAHVCIGPNLNTLFEVTINDPALVNLHMVRADKTLPCTPIGGRWASTNSRFAGFLTINNIRKTAECIEAVKDIPNSYWKAYVIDFVTNVCTAYGGCLSLSQFRRDKDYKNDAFTCVVDDAETFDFCTDCQISVEAKQYTGSYIMDDISAGNYSRYPKAYRVSYELDTYGVPVVVPNADGTYNVNSAYMEKVFGTEEYMLKGLDEEFVAEVDAIFYKEFPNYNRPIYYNHVKVGVLNRDTIGCYPIQEKKVLSENSSFLGYISFSENIDSLVDCNIQVDLARPNTSWAVYVRNGSSCVVYGWGLDETELQVMVVADNDENDNYTCTIAGTTVDYTTIIGPGCVVTVEKDPSYAGVYTADLTFKDNPTAVPYLRRKTLMLDMHNGIHYSPFDSAYIHLGTDSEGVERLMLSDLYDAENWIISTTAHLCQEELPEGQNYSSKFSILDPETNLASGLAYKVSEDNACYPVSGVRSIPLDFDGFHVSNAASFYDCRATADTATSNTRWKALVKSPRVCFAIGLGLDTTRFTAERGESEDDTCIYPKYFTRMRDDINPYCLIVVYGRDKYRGLYRMDLTYTRNFGSLYPRSVETALVQGTEAISFGYELSNSLTYSADQRRMTFNGLNVYFDVPEFPCSRNNNEEGPWPVLQGDGLSTDSKVMVYSDTMPLQLNCRRVRGDLGHFEVNCGFGEHIVCWFKREEFVTCLY